MLQAAITLPGACDDSAEIEAFVTTQGPTTFCQGIRLSAVAQQLLYMCTGTACLRTILGGLHGYSCETIHVLMFWPSAGLALNIAFF